MSNSTAAPSGDYVRIRISTNCADAANIAIPTSVEKSSYQRNLPHRFPKGSAVFITWRLHGCLPLAFLRATRNIAGLSEGQKFERIDSYLDREKKGPTWLQNPALAEMICECIERGARPPLLHYTLHEYVFMPNHVHVLLTPRVDVWRITKGIKGTTAREANMALGRTGHPFWQDESYDHFCRNPAEFEKIQAYILRNPLKAGLVAEITDWPWSSYSRLLKSGQALEIAQPAPH